MLKPRSPLDRLTCQQREVVLLVSKGLRNSEIARQLKVSEGAVKYHISRMLVAFGASNRTDLSFEYTAEQDQAPSARRP